MKKNVTKLIANNMANTLMKPVVVIGGGWSGLAAAAYLAQQNIPTILLESAKQLGGRARCVNVQNQTLDNGQHLMIGAYSEMLSLLKLFGVREQTVFYRLPQHLTLIDAHSGDTVIDMRLPRWPKPLNLLWGMLRCKGLNFAEKIRTLKQFDQLLKKPIAPEHDQSVSQWLSSANLPNSYLLLLDTLCLAALNTPIDKASALSFQSVLNETFNGANGSTDLLIPRDDLSAVFPDPARQYLTEQEAIIHYPRKVERLEMDTKGDISRVVTDHESFEASAVILATSPNNTKRLLEPLNQCKELVTTLDLFEYEPICTVYLQYPEHIELPVPMLGFTQSRTQWLFDRRVCGQPGLMAAVISAGGEHMDWDNEKLALQVGYELSQRYPDWPDVQRAWVIREKRATFACTPDSHQIRPPTATSIDNLFLTGDYVANDKLFLPATLETAIRNAKAAAQQVIKYLSN